MMLKLENRNLEKRILLTITAAAILILFPFMIISILSQDKLNIIVDIIAVGGFICVFIGVWFTDKIRFFNGMFTAIAYINILVGIYIKGAGLIYWLFPIIIASFYLLPIIVASLFNVLLISIAYFLTYDQFDSFTLPRIMAALIVTGIFSLICSMFMQNKNRQLLEKDKISQVHNNILELIASSSPLPKILMAITYAVENEFSNALCSILLLDKTGKHLEVAAAPNLPDLYHEVMNGSAIVDGSDSSGAAAYAGKRVIFADITTHPYWKSLAALSTKSKLEACWSEPLIDKQGNVLGALSIYHSKKSPPERAEFELIEQFVNLARIAIEREKADQIIWQQANYDDLTKLPNRYLLHEHLKSAITNAQREKKQLAIAMLDLNKFKEVNDTLGHASGDNVLIECSKRIKGCIRKNDIAARLGGDEFIIVFVGATKSEDIDHIGQKLSTTLAKPYFIQGESIYCTASIGVAFYRTDAISIDDLLRHADQAMYMAKTEGKNRVHFFKDEA